MEPRRSGGLVRGGALHAPARRLRPGVGPAAELAEHGVEVIAVSTLAEALEQL